MAICKECLEKPAEEHSEFCSPACAAAYMEHHTKICKTCGRRFVPQKSKPYLTECTKCYYRRHFGAAKKPKSKTGENGIDAIISQQNEIRQKTGRWLSYGEIMAKKSQQ